MVKFPVIKLDFYLINVISTLLNNNDQIKTVKMNENNIVALNINVPKVIFFQ